MNRKLIIIPIIVIILAVFSINFFSADQEKKESPTFHVTLATPDQYQNGVYSSSFFLKKGDYSFSFVPNGDSPKKLGIYLTGENFEVSKTFELIGEPHETGISKYYTWDYEGEKSFHVEMEQDVSIQINPNGNVLGSVSVDISKTE